jgi:hypothetical protein
MIVGLVITSRPLASTELHVFHYPTHSAIHVLGVFSETTCLVSSISHEHTRDGGDLLRSYRQFATRAEAEQYVEEIADDCATVPGRGPLTVFRHDTTPAALFYAVKIKTKKDPNGNPRRGWIIYDHTGKQTGFIEEGLEGAAALAEAGPVIELGAIPTNVDFYDEVRIPI